MIHKVIHWNFGKLTLVTNGNYTHPLRGILCGHPKSALALEHTA